jgi:hypothetical protein
VHEVKINNPLSTILVHNVASFFGTKLGWQAVSKTIAAREAGHVPVVQNPRKAETYSSTFSAWTVPATDRPVQVISRALAELG